MESPEDTIRQRVFEVAEYFEHLTPDRLDELERWYAVDARFKDPFNTVHGPPAIRKVFEHMYRRLDAPRFSVRDRVVDGQQALLTWDFLFRFRRSSALQTIRGASHLRFDDEGRIVEHRDYWDAAEELYEKLPILGGFMRFLKTRAAS